MFLMRSLSRRNFEVLLFAIRKISTQRMDEIKAPVGKNRKEQSLNEKILELQKVVHRIFSFKSHPFLFFQNLDI